MYFRLMFWLALFAGYSLVVTIITQNIWLPKWDWGDDMATVLGLGLGVFLGFRSRVAYDRWWEARTLWGRLINECRNLAIKTAAFAHVAVEDRAAFAELLAAFPHALRCHLRGKTEPLPAVESLYPEITSTQHRPGFIALQLFKYMDKWNRDNELSTSIRILERQANGLMDVCGGCERIRNTPIVTSYSYMAWSCVLLYCLVAPWGLAMSLGWSGLPIVLVATGFLVGMEIVAEEIAEPFGTEPDDLPLERYCDTIDAFVRETLV